MTSKTDKSYSYSDAGVDIGAGERLVERIKPMAASTRRPGADGDLGGFGGLFDLRAAGYTDPVLVAATDGVGTKVKLALDLGRLDSVGIDLVAMCVNDLIVQGAEPLFFLDYYAAGKLDVDRAAEVISGIAEGCRQAGAVLIGGETAEMPGLYAEGDFDLAGFAVGAVERGHILTGSTIEPGDVIIGVASSGVHSNGFSLVRKLLEEKGINLSDKSTFDPDRTFGEAFLEPTRIYVQSLLPAVRSGLVHGLAHITGGGLIENVPRILPKGMIAVIDATKWQLPGIFNWLREEGNLTPGELTRTFNCGIGMIVIAPQQFVVATVDVLENAGEKARIIGQIMRTGHGSRVQINGLQGTWGFTKSWRAESKGD